MKPFKLIARFIRQQLADICDLRAMWRCERETNHAQVPGRFFCRCCYKMYPSDDPFFRIAGMIHKARLEFGNN